MSDAPLFPDVEPRSAMQRGRSVWTGTPGILSETLAIASFVLLSVSVTTLEPFVADAYRGMLPHLSPKTGTRRLCLRMTANPHTKTFRRILPSLGGKLWTVHFCGRVCV